MTENHDQIKKRAAPIAMDAESFRRAGHALVDSISEFLGTLPQRRVTPDESPDAVRGVIDADAPLPEEGTDAGALLQRTAPLLFDHSLFNGHPRFMGYVTSSPAPIGMLGDFLAAAVNPNVGAWRIGPMATEIELQTVRWIAGPEGRPHRRAGDGRDSLDPGGRSPAHAGGPAAGGDSARRR